MPDHSRASESNPGRSGRETADPGSTGPQVPAIALPKGGGAIKGIGEKFAANPVTGTGTMQVPIATSPGRGGFGPQLALGYDSGAGNGAFGMGWSLGLPVITRKTDKGLPRYDDASDVFVLSGAEDLVPVLVARNGGWEPEILPVRTVGGRQYRVERYRPRVEGLFARIERWTDLADPAEVFWRSISRDNVTTWYGRTRESRIADPADPSRIFSWLICTGYDDKGSVIRYDYKAENADGVDLTKTSEYQRDRRANRYLKRIRYGNHAPYFPTLDPVAAWPELPADDEWYFELVFDYGEHDKDNPVPQDGPGWHDRPDPFSSYRSGFEVRTHRLCRRALMFHHFPDEPEVCAACLVRSTEFSYAHDVAPDDARDPIYAKLIVATQLGYRRHEGGYRSRSLPPLEFTYSAATIQSEVRELDRASLEGLPNGLDDNRYRWIDLDGDGVPGVLTEQAGEWFYKRNLSPASSIGAARLTHPELVESKPAVALADGARFVDLAGDGRPDVVRFDGPAPGFYERDEDAGWTSLASFAALPTLDWHDPNLRMVDLDGDGLADVLIAEQGAMVWHAALGEDGFGAEQRVAVGWDENRGPAVVFTDSEQTVHLADLSGDGLTDLVRIRNGEICYWPNLGYGRFGAKITMDNAPWFDHPDQFDSRRLLLADIDGSGTTDLLYLHTDGVRAYFNQSGNGWGNPVPLNVFPPVDNQTSVLALDLLGTGTACLVWSSPLLGDATAPLRYVDLMGDKPHLLVSVRNNLGAETEIRYAPSTKFYVQDELAGTPWVTKLPFPVHVVEQVTTRDRWRDTVFASTYSYHHGYFDGPEREFRGFARVDQIDVEDYGAFAAANADSSQISQDQRLYQPPVKTVTWYHTGAEGDRILHQLESEYFPRWFEDREPGTQVLGTFRERAMPEPDLETQGLIPDERREALRACRGMLLRQEIYELDAVALASGQHRPVRLFTATMHTCRIRQVQPRKGNRYTVVHATERETIGYHYELDLRPATVTPDPRITHTLNLRVDEYGNVLQSVSAGYPRWQAVPLGDPHLPAGVARLVAAVQDQVHLGYTEVAYTNDVVADSDAYRLRSACATTVSELTGIAPVGRYFSLDQLRMFRLSDRYPSGETVVPVIPYHQLPDHAQPQRRVVESARSLFFDDTLAAPLPFGVIDARGLPYETYTLALTDALLTAVFGDKLTPDVTAALGNGPTSGYLSGQALHQRLGADTAGQHWRCSGIAGFTADAAQHFFLPERFTDPFGNATVLDYDPRDLYLRSSTDALGNRTEAVEFDFRVLAPRQIRDVNGNSAHIRFDVLGMPAVIALTGKAGEGDRIDGFDGVAVDPDPAVLVDFFVTADYDPAKAAALLGDVTSRSLYYFGETRSGGGVVWGVHPPCAAGITREYHGAQRPNSPVRTAFEYSDGSGSLVVAKIQAEPESPGGPLRWVTNGKTILNNKGKPVKKYEPYFSPPEVGHRFEEPREIGVTPVVFYDAVGRTIRTEAPDGGVARIEYSPWEVLGYDVNDTVLDPGNAWYARMSASPVAAERRAAQLAAAHADTPMRTLSDSLGRGVVTIAHNRAGGVDEKCVTFSKFDTEGKPLWIQDPRGNRVVQSVLPPLPGGVKPFDDPQNLLARDVVPCYDIGGRALFQHSMDAGDLWTLQDAAGKPFFGWNSRGFRSRTTYDALHRPLGQFVLATGDTTLTGAPRDPAAPPTAEVLVERHVYGETHPDASTNLRGKAFRSYDSAGVTTVPRYDFKGNVLSSDRRFARDHKGVPDWSALAELTDIDEIASAAEPLLDSAPPLSVRTDFDAFNRPTVVTTPDRSEYRATYNAAGLLERVAVRLRGAPTATSFVTDIAYNAKGQRVQIDYGNGASSAYQYDPFTFRLTGLRTTRPAGADPTASLLFENAAVVQDLHYTYDPTGNITRIADIALKTTVQAGATSDYVYDALYRLITASGREHSGQTEFALSPTGTSRRDYPFTGARVHANDLLGLRDYVENYRYDAVGNIMQLVHHSGNNVDQPGQTLWQRRYQYALDSNRLLATSVPGDPDALPDYVEVGGYSAKYGYNISGDITSMAHLPTMRWDYRDQLRATAQQVVTSGTPETTYYVYGGSGERVRKITETATGAIKNERIYLAGYEIYREYRAGTVTLQRDTVHVMDDKQRIALIETETAARIRYQLGNHLGSSSIELDHAGAVIGYEDYHPYGTTAFQAGRNVAEVGLKRYRYTGKERDDETGFNYHGARYYAPWLGRWASADPLGIQAGVNFYAYAGLSPVCRVDPHGTKDTPADLTNQQITAIFNKSGSMDEFKFNLGLGPTTDEAFGKYLNDKKWSIPGTEQKAEKYSGPSIKAGWDPNDRTERTILVRDAIDPLIKHETKGFATAAEAEEAEIVAGRQQHKRALEAAAGGLAAVPGLRAANKAAGAPLPETRPTAWGAPTTDVSPGALVGGGRANLGGASRKSPFEIASQINLADRRGTPLNFETVKDMIKATGRNVPDDIEFTIGNPGKDKWASYDVQVRPEGKHVEWSNYLKDGKVQVIVARQVMWKPELAMRAIVHELYEIEGLRAEFEKRGTMHESEVGKKIDELHLNAIQVESVAWKQWLKLPKAKE